MAQRERIQALIEGLGPGDDEIATVAQDGDAAWAIAYHGDTIVALDLAGTQDRLVLSVDLGRPAPEHRVAVYESVLSYNMLGLETGGVKIGLSVDRGELVQMVELSTSGLDRDRLRKSLRGFVEKARVWRRVIAEERHGGTDPEVPLAEEMIIRG